MFKGSTGESNFDRTNFNSFGKFEVERVLKISGRVSHREEDNFSLVPLLAESPVYRSGTGSLVH